MHPPAIVSALFDAWDDLDRVTSGLTPAEAQDGSHGSAYGWTVAHLANQVDSWILVRFGGGEPHPDVNRARYRFGADGSADDWPVIQAAATEVRQRAAAYLAARTEDDLAASVPYPGSLPELRGTQVSLRYTLLRVLAHHYFHIGELATKRSAAGTGVGDYPGTMRAVLETEAHR